MKGLKVTEKRLSAVLLHPEARFEAEFYLAQDGVLKNYMLGETAVPFVQYGTSDELNGEGLGYPVLRLNEIYNGFVEKAEKCCASLTAEEFDALRLKKNDVLICRTNGNPRLVGMAGLVMEDAPIAYASYLFRARPNPDVISPAALMVFLNSTKGRLEIEKHSIRSNQVNFSPERLRQARIPRFGKAFLQQIDSTVDVVYSERRDADSNYVEADNMLLRALGLEDWRPPEPLTYTRRASDVFAAGRFDAEHYQPRYLSLLEHIRRHAVRCRSIEEFAVHCDRGQQPQYVDDGPLTVITSKHILETGLDYDNFDRTHADYWDKSDFESARIYPQDILTYTTGAKVGRTACYLASDRALASNHVNLVRVKRENPLYVATVMNSMIGRWQTQMYVSGSAQVELYPSDIRRFVIPFVDDNTQVAIADAVLHSYKSQRRAYVLLERAKRAVEIAIEETEATALRFLAESL